MNTFIWVDIVFIPNDGNRSCSTQRFAYLAVLIGSSDYRQVIIERDDEVIAVIIEKLKEFWKMVETNTPPSVRGKDLLAEAGIDNTFRVHDMRHTHATLLLEAGVNVKVVSERLGHASTRITLDLYAHVLKTMQAAAVDALNKMF